MKYITVKLTEDQALAVYEMVNVECYDNAQDEHYYAFLHRIRVKLNKAMRASKS